MNVMIVDDTPDVRLVLRTALDVEGIDSTEAGSGPVALDMLERGLRPNVILLDVQMPLMDGWSVLSKIRSSPELSNLRVVMCTVKDSVDDLISGWELGCDGYVSKPFDLSTIIDEIQIVASRPEELLHSFRNQQVETLRSLT
ncbi:MAG: response regulator [Actinomycetota bacterium]